MPVPVVVSVASYTAPAGSPYVTLTSPMSFPVTISGANPGLLVFLNAVIDPSVVPTCLIGSVEVPLIDMTTNSYALCAFFLANPPTGSQTVTITTRLVAGGYEHGAVALCLDRVDPTARHGVTIAEIDASTTTPALTIEMSAGDLAIGIIQGDPSSIGAGQTEVTQLTTNQYNFGSLNVVSKTADGSLAWTFGSSGTRAMVGVSIKPVGASGTPPLPALQIFDRNTLSAGTVECAGIDTSYQGYLANGVGADSDNITSEQGYYSWYYDSTAVHLHIAKHRNEVEPWTTAAYQSLFVVDGVRYAPQGYYANAWQYFTHGPALMWLKTGESHYLDIVHGLRDAPSYSQDGDNLATTNGALERELAYHIFALVWGIRLGFPERTARLTQCRDWAYDYFDYWINEDWTGIDRAVQPFMFGILMRAVIEDWELSKDSRCIPAIQAMCDYTWQEAWHPTTCGFLYNLNPAFTTFGEVPSGQGKSTYGAPVLGNLTGPAYAWLALQLRDTEPTAANEYMRRADLSFTGSAVAIAGSRGKQFNQMHTWVYDQLKWRREFYNPPPRRSARIGRTI